VTRGWRGLVGLILEELIRVCCDKRNGLGKDGKAVIVEGRRGISQKKVVM
jgi:hypothetical protein